MPNEKSSLSLFASFPLYFVHEFLKNTTWLLTRKIESGYVPKNSVLCSVHPTAIFFLLLTFKTTTAWVFQSLMPSVRLYSSFITITVLYTLHVLCWSAPLNNSKNSWEVKFVWNPKNCDCGTQYSASEHKNRVKLLSIDNMEPKWRPIVAFRSI